MMAKPKGAAGKTAKKQPRRKSEAVGDITPTEAPKIAYLVKSGSDEEIRETLARKIEGFDEWPEPEKAEAVRLTQKFWQRTMPPPLEIAEDNKICPQGDLSLAVLRLSETFASPSEHLFNDRLAQLANYLKATPEGFNSANVSAAVAFVAGGGAQDPVQSSLLTQMAATHDAAMRALKRMANAEYVETAQTFGNLSTKLLNVYTRQAETLAKLQRGAEQTVRHVYVDARTQTAINCPPTHTESRSSPHEQHEGRAFGPAMLGYHPEWNGLPTPSDEGKEAVQSTRRQIDRSAGK